MFSSIPQGFFDVENMEKLGAMYRDKVGPNPADILDQAVKDAKKDFSQPFDLQELRDAYPEANQEKQSIEINLTTGNATINRLKLVNGQYQHKTMEDVIDKSEIDKDILKFEKAGFVSYRVKSNNQILYLTKFNVL